MTRAAADPFPWSGDINALDPTDQRAVAELVVEGKAVTGTVQDLLARLARTRCVALLRETGTNRIVAAAAWKTPATTYRRKSFAAAAVPIAGFEAAPELGYVVIASDMQGRHLSGGLIDAIVEHITEPSFATQPPALWIHPCRRRLGGQGWHIVLVDDHPWLSWGSSRHEGHYPSSRGHRERLRYSGRPIDLVKRCPGLVG